MGTFHPFESAAAACSGRVQLSLLRTLLTLCCRLGNLHHHPAAAGAPGSQAGQGGAEAAKEARLREVAALLVGALRVPSADSMKLLALEWAERFVLSGVSALPALPLGGGGGGGGPSSPDLFGLSYQDYHLKSSACSVFVWSFSYQG